MLFYAMEGNPNECPDKIIFDVQVLPREASGYSEMGQIAARGIGKRFDIDPANIMPRFSCVDREFHEVLDTPTSEMLDPQANEFDFRDTTVRRVLEATKNARVESARKLVALGGERVSRIRNIGEAGMGVIGVALGHLGLDGVFEGAPGVRNVAHFYGNPYKVPVGVLDLDKRYPYCASVIKPGESLGRLTDLKHSELVDKLASPKFFSSDTAMFNEGPDLDQAASDILKQTRNFIDQFVEQRSELPEEN